MLFYSSYSMFLALTNGTTGPRSRQRLRGWRQLALDRGAINVTFDACAHIVRQDTHQAEVTQI